MTPLVKDELIGPRGQDYGHTLWVNGPAVLEPRRPLLIKADIHSLPVRLEVDAIDLLAKEPRLWLLDCARLCPYPGKRSKVLASSIR